MRSIHQWLNDYGSSHRNPKNKLAHWIGIPIIVFSLAGLFWAVPLFKSADFPYMNAAVLLAAVFTIYYCLLSLRLAAGMLLVFVVMFVGLALSEQWLQDQFVPSMLALFVGGWVLQFLGHKIEGKKPSFLEDLQFLMIGPLWLLADVYRRLGLRI